MQQHLKSCRKIEDLDLDLDKAERVWDRSLGLPESPVPQADRWYHGDLVAENLLLKDGRLSAVIDFGSVAVGDPTVDIHGAWELFDAAEREIFAEHVRVSEAEWLRGHTLALGISLERSPTTGTPCPAAMKTGSQWRATHSTDSRISALRLQERSPALHATSSGVIPRSCSSKSRRFNRSS